MYMQVSYQKYVSYKKWILTISYKIWSWPPSYKSLKDAMAALAEAWIALDRELQRERLYSFVT